MSPLISVFVPTKNRYFFLKELISLVDSYNDSRIELVIQDNSDDNSEIVKYLGGKNFSCVKYFYNNTKLSMSENGNLAFSHCAGEYVCMIGDDDAVCRNIADCAQWMKDNKIDALRSAEVQFIYEGNNDDILYYEPCSPSYRRLNPVKEIKKILKNGLVDFGMIAKVYHGIAKRSMLQEFLSLHQKDTIFPGCTPDMSGAIVTSLASNNYVKLNFPVVLPGLSKMNSGGLSGQILTLDEVPWITQETRNNWEANIPRIWAREFIWPESGSKGLRYCGREDLLDRYMNYYMTRCRYILMHKQHRSEVISTSPSKLLLYWALFKTIVKVGGRYFLNRKVLARINHRKNGIYDFTHDCHTVKEAEKYLYEKGYYYNFNQIG